MKGACACDLRKSGLSGRARHEASPADPAALSRAERGSPDKSGACVGVIDTPASWLHAYGRPAGLRELIRPDLSLLDGSEERATEVLRHAPTGGPARFAGGCVHEKSGPSDLVEPA